VANSAAGLRIVISDPAALDACARVSKASAARARDAGCAHARRIPGEVTLPGSYSIAGACATPSAVCRVLLRWRRFEPPTRLFETTPSPKRRAPTAGDVQPDWNSPLLQRRPCRRKSPRHFVWFSRLARRHLRGVHPQTALSKKGSRLTRKFRCCAPSASTAHSMRRSRPSSTRAMPARCRITSVRVKAPALVCDAVMRDEQGRGKVPNPHFLDASIASREFVVPASRGSCQAGPLVFQVSPCRAAGGGGGNAGRATGGLFAALRRSSASTGRSMPWRYALGMLSRADEDAAG